MDEIIHGSDPHGDWRPLLHACSGDTLDEVVLVGGCGLDVILGQKLRPPVESEIETRTTPGNYDAGSEAPTTISGATTPPGTSMRA